MEPTKKSPNRSLWCSSRLLVPMCVAISHHSVCCSVTGSVSPRWPELFHVCRFKCVCCIGLVPLPSLFRCFLAAFNASRDDVKTLSLRMQYVFCKSWVRCLSMLLWNDVSVSGSYWVPSFFLTVIKKWLRSLSSSKGGIYHSILYSLHVLAHHCCHFLKSLSVLRFVLLFLCWSLDILIF